MSNESDFINGLYVNEAKPDFILCELGIQADRFCEYVQANKNEKGNVRINIARSKDGQKLYAKLNTWQPQAEQQGYAVNPVQQEYVAPPEVTPAVPAEDEPEIPF